MTYTIITGASAGLGALFAKELAKEGRDLVLMARRGDRLVALAEAIKSGSSVDVETVAIDLTDTSAVEHWFETEGKALAIDSLVNNAGFDVTGIRNIITIAFMRLTTWSFNKKNGWLFAGLMCGSHN